LQRSVGNSLDFIEFDGIIPPVIKSCYAGRFMCGHLLRNLQPAAVL
jgi:hypothetical protein